MRPEQLSDLSTVTAGSSVSTPVIDMQGFNNVQLSLLINQLSDKVGGVLTTSVQGSGDGQNWSELTSLAASVTDQASQLTKDILIATRFLRFVTTASPAGNTVSFAVTWNLSQQS